MIFVNIEQNTKEWLAFRSDHIGASDCGPIMKDSPFKSPRKLWEEKFSPVSFSQNEAMKRGHNLEPIAREHYNKLSGKNFVPKVAVSKCRPWQSASFDGLDLEEEIVLEIKCPGEKVFGEMAKGVIAKTYLWQIQHQLCVSNYKKAILFVFNGETGIEIAYERNESMIRELIREEGVFYDKNMLKWIPPETNKEAPVIRIDMEDLLKEAYESNQEMLYYRKKYENLKEEIKIKCGDRSVESSFYKFIKTKRKGTVQYKNIPELDNVDLDNYRAPDTEAWSITLA